MEQFYQLARQIHAEKVAERRRQVRAADYQGNFIYTMFSFWCDIHKGGKEKDNPKVFAEYLKCENISLTPRQRIYIAKRYFGYNFTYNYEKKRLGDN